jgi:hypothetical protein
LRNPTSAMTSTGRCGVVFRAASCCACVMLWHACLPSAQNAIVTPRSTSFDLAPLMPFARAAWRSVARRRTEHECLWPKSDNFGQPKVSKPNRQVGEQYVGRFHIKVKGPGVAVQSVQRNARARCVGLQRGRP